MIFVDRTAQPKILRDNAVAWTQAYIKARAEYQANKTDQFEKAMKSAESKYNHEQVKDALKTMFRRKCAFCESTVTHVSYGDIEHFKPKSLYPNLCFDWNNYLLSCSICNGKSNKGNKFPLEDEGGPFINPTIENPDDFFRFEYDAVLKKFVVFPKSIRAVTMLKIININREDLVEDRTLYLSKVINTISKIIEQDTAKLEIFMNEFSAADPYYAFIKTIFAKLRTT